MARTLVAFIVSWQAREKSYDRWGGEEELELERERRKKRKYEAALQKTNAVMKKKAT